MSLNSIVKKQGYERFCLCCNTSAFVFTNREFASEQREEPPKLDKVEEPPREISPPVPVVVAGGDI